MRMYAFLPLVGLIGALGFGSAASAQQSGTAADAKALLAKGTAAVKADKAGALAKFDDPAGGFKDRDLYVFCFEIKSGLGLSGPTKGKDLRTLKDSTGKAFGQEMVDKAKDGQVVTIDYMFPRPNTTDPVAKESFIEGIGDIACGVGYYK
jgi:hypothetical protein